MVCYFGALDGLGCLKSHRLPFRHPPRRMRKGQGVEHFKAKFCPLFVPSLLANFRDLCDTDDNLLALDCFGEAALWSILRHFSLV